MHLGGLREPSISDPAVLANRTTAMRNAQLEQLVDASGSRFVDKYNLRAPVGVAAPPLYISAWMKMDVRWR